VHGRLVLSPILAAGSGGHDGRPRDTLHHSIMGARAAVVLGIIVLLTYGFEIVPAYQGLLGFRTGQGQELSRGLNPVIPISIIQRAVRLGWPNASVKLHLTFNPE